MAKNPKMVICRNCNNPMSEKAKVCPSCGAKNKKPFYKKGWFIILAIIVVVGVIGSIGGGNKNVKDAEKFEWTDIEMHEALPQPQNLYGEIGHNSKTALILTLCEIDEKAFKSYRDECIDEGYTIDADESYLSYSAYNSDGCSVRLVFSESSQEMNVYLDAPEEMGEFEWPTNGLGAMLPATESTVGDISWDNSETFIVHVGDTPIEDYKDYVKVCEDIGFTIDYSRDDEYYSAENAEGYKLTLRYLGFNKIEISLKAPEETSVPAEDNTKPNETPKSEDTTKPEETTPPKDTSNNTGLDPDFKEAMDSYEEFMNEYVAFMKKYSANPSDLGLLANYAKIMGEYADFVEDFEKWEDADLNAEETKYYLEVQNRVTQKLLEVAG